MAAHTEHISRGPPMWSLLRRAQGQLAEPPIPAGGCWWASRGSRRKRRPRGEAAARGAGCCPAAGSGWVSMTTGNWTSWWAGGSPQRAGAGRPRRPAVLRLHTGERGPPRQRLRSSGNPQAGIGKQCWALFWAPLAHSNRRMQEAGWPRFCLLIAANRIPFLGKMTAAGELSA